MKLVSDHNAFLALPEIIKAAADHLEMMHVEYVRHGLADKSGSKSGHTRADIATQSGYVWGLKRAMVELLQQHWCEKNDKPVPRATMDDVERYLRDYLKVIR
jgi:hypothetical protein